MSTPQLQPRLEQALATWPRWKVGSRQIELSVPPRLEKQLPGGLSNQTWLVSTSEGPCVARINSPRDAVFNVDRHREAVVLEVLSEECFVPQVWFCDPACGVLVTEYIEGNTLDVVGSQNPVYRAQVQTILNRLKEIDLPLTPFDYWRHLCHYRDQLLNKQVVLPSELEEVFATFVERIQVFQRSGWQPVLVHHDLTPANIIVQRERLVIIDWEYAAMGYPGMDSYLWSPAKEPFGDVVSAYLKLIDGYWHLLSEGG